MGASAAAPRPLVLVVEDHPANLRLVRALLGRAGYRVVEATSVAAVVERLAEITPDLILRDLQLPDGDGLDLTRRLKGDAATAGIPIAALTAYAMAGDREKALAAGCVGYISKPVDTRAFGAQVSVAPGLGEETTREVMAMPRVLLVDDDAANLRLLEAVLARDGYQVTGVQSGEDALREVSQAPLDLVLLDLRMPGLDGFAVLERLKAEAATRLVPVVVVTGSGARAERLRAVELGADDFLTKPVDRVELRARVRALLRLKHHVDEMERTENMLLALGRTVEARDPALGEHCERLARRVIGVGRDLGLGGEGLRALRLGAYLHDIGKIGIPDSVLLKPGPLNAAERAMVRTHPVVGESILAPLVTLHPVLPLVRHHHERLDGSGYPDGLRGEEIPLPVRILSVVDVFDALTTRRPYRDAMADGAAVAVLRAEAAQGYWDAEIVRCLAEQVLPRSRGHRAGPCPSASPGEEAEE